MYPKGLDIQRLTDNQVKFAFGGHSPLRKLNLEGFKVNPLIYPKELDIQRLTDNQVKFAFEKVQLRRMHVNPLMYPKWLDI